MTIGNRKGQHYTWDQEDDIKSGGYIGAWVEADANGYPTLTGAHPVVTYEPHDPTVPISARKWRHHWRDFPLQKFVHDIASRFHRAMSAFYSTMDLFPLGDPVCYCVLDFVIRLGY